MMMPDAPDALRRSQQVGEFVDSPGTSLGLRCKSLRQFVAVALATSLEVEQIMHANAAVSADSVRGDLAAVEELVEMGSAHPEPLSGDARAQDVITADRGELGSGAHATGDVQQRLTHLGAGVLGIIVERSELLWGNRGSFDGLHVYRPQMSQMF